MSRIRSVYLNDQEELGLQTFAEDNGMSINYVLRLALRSLLGLPIGPSDRKLVASLRQ